MAKASSLTGHRAHLVPLGLTLTLHSHSWQWLCISEEPVLGSIPVPNPLPPGMPMANIGCLTIPPQHSWEASGLCLARGPLLSQEKQEICWERGPAPSRVRNQEQDSPGDFILVTPKQIVCPLRRHFKQHLLEGEHTIKNTNNHIKKIKPNPAD